MLKRILFAIIVFSFISCQGPDEPDGAVIYPVLSLIDKTINSVDITWNETSLVKFGSYEIFYKEHHNSVEPTRFITITHKDMVHTTITGLKPIVQYRIFIVTVDKNGNKNTSPEILDKYKEGGKVVTPNSN